MTACPLLLAGAMRHLGVSLSVFIALLTVGCTDDEEDAGDDDEVVAADADDPPGAMPAIDPTTGELQASRIQILRGVDRAGAFTTREAKILKRNYGVRWTGVYIGGPCSGGFGWTKARVKAIATATSWQFMPIFVGQQSPSICGAHRLTYAQGVTDAKQTVKRMRAFGWLPHRAIPVALDVEAGAYYYSPSKSTRYVRGWVNQMRASGYRAYVYGSPFGLNHWRAAGVRIDAAWAASYFYQGFRRVKPGQLDQLTAFRNHNRAWQYAGNFRVSGAGYVDANTSNLLLAPKPGGSNLAAMAARMAPSQCGALEPGEGLEQGEALKSCDGHNVLSLGTDGELVLRHDGAVVWSADTLGAGVAAVMLENGELVVVDDENEPVFTTDTGGFPEARLVVGDSLALVGDDDAALWTSNDGSRVAPERLDDMIDLELDE